MSSSRDRLQRLRVRPTTLGVKALVFWFVIFAAWLATPYSNLFFLLLCLLSVLAPLSILWSVQNLRGIGASIDRIPPCAAHTHGNVSVQLVGSRARKSQGLELELRVEGNTRSARRGFRSGFAIEAKPGAALNARTPARERGIWAIHDAFLTSVAPLGLVRVRRPLDAPIDIAVHPEPASLPSYRDRSALLASLRGGSQHTSDGDFGPAGLREFREGDEARHVDWRATARKTNLVVREWENDAIQGIEISLDRRCSEDELEEALELATALLFVAREDKDVFAISTQGHTARYGEGKAPYDDALRFFASCTTLSPTDPAPPAASRDVLRLPAATGGAR